MEENKKRIEELMNYITKWQEELNTIWKGKETEVAEVEKRNLKNLISNAQKEIDELNGIQKIEKITEDPKDLLEQLKQEKQKNQQAKGELSRHMEKLAEEMKNYEDEKDTTYQDIYTEYENQIKSLKDKVLEMEKEENQVENRDFKIRVLTKGRMDTENEISEIEKQIRNKQKEISEIQYGTDDAMEEKELSDGTKVKVPKINRIYREIDKLKETLKEKQSLRDEFQQYIDELKGKEEKVKSTRQEDEISLKEEDEISPREENGVPQKGEDEIPFKKGDGVSPKGKDEIFSKREKETPSTGGNLADSKKMKASPMENKLAIHVNQRTGEVILYTGSEIKQKRVIEKEIYSSKYLNKFASFLLKEYNQKINEDLSNRLNKNVSRVLDSIDPTIYHTLVDYDKKEGTNNKDLYVEAIIKAVDGRKDEAKKTMPCEIVYDLRKKNDREEKENLVEGKAKLGWLQKRRLRKIARNQGEPTKFFRRKALNLAIVKEDNYILKTLLMSGKTKVIGDGKEEKSKVPMNQKNMGKIEQKDSKEEIKVDKFGNRVELTEEEKEQKGKEMQSKEKIVKNNVTGKER